MAADTNPFTDKTTLLMVLLGICTVNGIFSPYLNIAIPVTTVLMPEVFPKTREWVLFFSSVFVASCTLFFSGVPAALYERFARPEPDSPAPLYIWIAGALFLALPALDTIGGR